jgi:hypothetical protein
MWKVLVATVCYAFLSGCDQLKGPGAAAPAAGPGCASTAVSTQVYTCPPTANPYYKACSWLRDTVLPAKPVKKDN